MPIWLSRTIPMSKYFSGSRRLRHNEVQLYSVSVIYWGHMCPMNIYSFGIYFMRKVEKHSLEPQIVFTI